MVNYITKDSWELWKDNISYIIYHSPKSDPDNIAESILDYLQGEGAFDIIKDEEDEAPLPIEEPTGQADRDTGPKTLLESTRQWSEAIEKRGCVN